MNLIESKITNTSLEYTVLKLRLDLHALVKDYTIEHVHHLDCVVVDLNQVVVNYFVKVGC